ncbi:MAG: hypothetical protein IJY23_06650 [Clostridia bacterium]|nr:hypothetical protein [Clostridia bacterium]
MKENKKKAKATPTKKASLSGAKRTRRIVIILVSVLVGIAVVLGAVLGIVAAVRRASHVMRLEDIGINEGVASYLSSVFKSMYMQNLASSGVSVSDTESFWNTKVFRENTYADYLEYETTQYIKQIIAANVIFDSYTTLKSADKSKIEQATNEILVYQSGGDKGAFNEATEAMGFDYKDFKKATEILYKAYMIKSRIFGDSGERMSSFPEELESFYSGYARVKLIFIRTQDTFVLDESGNRVQDSDGNDSLRALTAEEKSERAAYIERLDACIAGINDGTVAPEYYDSLAAEIYGKYKENIDTALTTGYYFMSGSKFTTEFSEAFSDVVKTSSSLGIGEAGVVEYGSIMADDGEDEKKQLEFVGRCYIYRVERESAAYEKEDKNGFFSDFSSLAATSVCQKMINDYAAKVEILDKWENINPVAIPYNTNYVAKF